MKKSSATKKKKNKPIDHEDSIRQSKNLKSEISKLEVFDSPALVIPPCMIGHFPAELDFTISLLMLFFNSFKKNY